MFIQKIMTEIKKQNLGLAENEKNQNLINIYSFLEELLNKKESGSLLTQIISAAFFIQKIKTERDQYQYLFASVSTIKKMQQDNGHPIIELTKNNKPSFPSFEPIPYEHGLFLADIHSSLLHYYLNLQKKWQYIYETNESDVIDNPAIREWQKDQMKLAQSSAYVDFKRDISILNEKGGSDKDVKKRINQLLSQAYQYDKDQLIILEQWLEKNGGQGIESLINHLFAHQHFHPQHLVNGLSKSLGHNWYSENGKLHYNYITQIYCLRIYNDPTHSAFIKLDNGDTKFVSIHKQKKITNQEQLPHPLMTIRCHIELDVMNSKVLPKVKSLIITSMCDILEKPNQTTIMQLVKEEKNNIHYSPVAFFTKTLHIKQLSDDTCYNSEAKQHSGP